MSGMIDKDPSAFFTVVGAPYVREHHVDDSGHYSENHETWLRETGGATLWLIFYAAIIGFSLVANGGATKLLEFASVALKRTFHL
jgi:hypothetical protein